MHITIGLDKMKVKHCYTTSPHGKDEYAQLHGWKESVKQKEFGPNGKVWKKHELSALTNISQPLPEGGSLVVMHGFAGGKQSAWLQFNPRKLSPNDLARLKVYMDMLLCHGFRTLCWNGTVSYAEIAIDVHGAAFKDYMYVDASLRSAFGGYGKVGTAYLGSPKSNRSFTCYDKSNEQEHKGIYAEQTLRLEAKMQGAKAFALADILNLPSPFATLMVIDRQALNESEYPLARKFRMRVNDTGLTPQEVYFHSPLPERKALQKALCELQPDWWASCKIWTGFPDSLAWMFELLD